MEKGRNTPIITPNVIHEPYERPRAFERFEEIEAAVRKISGRESAEILDEIGRKINIYYKNLTPRKCQEENNAFGLPTDLSIDRTIIDIPLHKLFKEVKNEGPDRKITPLLISFDPYQPLIRIFMQEMVHSSIERLARLIYLFYQIENIYIQPSREAEEIIFTLEQRRLESSGEILDPVIRKRLLLSIDALLMAAYELDNSWAYFGAENAQNILSLLTEGKYGLLLFNDMIELAKRGIVFPPQLFSLMRRINQGRRGISVNDLIFFYDNGRRLKNLEPPNILISGMNRAWEYTYEEMEEFIPPSLRQSSILALGSCIGLNEIQRAKMLGLSGRIIGVDREPRITAIRKSLVLKNELTYDNFPEVPPAQIYQIQKESNYIHLCAELPLTLEKLQELARSNGAGDLSDVRIISDQRASALYLSGDSFLESIRTSLLLLHQNRGGVYFLTRGLTDRLVVDLVIRIGPRENKVLCLEHTSGISIEAPLVKGNQLFLGQFQIGKRRINQDNYSLPFQKERQSQSLEQKVICSSLEYIYQFISLEFGSACFLVAHVDGGSFDKDLIFAYAKKIGLPVPLPPIIKTEEEKKQYLKFLDFLGEVIILAQENPELLQNILLPPVNIEGEIFFALNNAIYFFVTNLRNNFGFRMKFVNAARRIKVLFETTPLLNIVPSERRCQSWDKIFDIEQQLRSQMWGEILNRVTRLTFLRDYPYTYLYFFINSEKSFHFIFDNVIFPAILRSMGISTGTIIWEGDADYERIINQVILKIRSRGRHRMDFSTIESPEYFQSLIEKLKDYDQIIHLWELVVDVANTIFLTKSRQLFGACCVGLPHINY